MHIAEEVYYKILGYVAAAFGALLACGWTLVRYIFRHHVEENERCVEELRADIEREFGRINARIDRLYDKD